MLSQEELKIRKQNVFSMLKDKRNFVQKYGKDAEKVMYSISTTQAIKKMKDSKIKPLYKLK